MQIEKCLSKIILVGAISFLAPLPGYRTIASSPNLLEKATVFLEQDNDEAALRCLNTLLNSDRSNANAFCERSYVYARACKFRKALIDNNKAIALNPKLAKAYAYRALIHMNQSNCWQAIGDSKRAIMLNPNLALAYAIRAQIYERLKKYQKAVIDCNKAITLDIRNPKYYLIRASSLRGLKQYQKSIQDCNKAMNLVSNKAMPYLERGLTYSGLGNDQKALNDYTTAIRIRPQHPLAYILRAIELDHIGQYHKAIKDLSSAASLSPTNEKIYLLRASAFYELKLLKNAIEDCEKVIKLNQSSSEAYLVAARAYEELGLFEKAIAMHSELLDIEKKKAIYWSDRARNYNLTGKFLLAKKDWQKAKQLASADELITIKLDNPLMDFTKFEMKNPFVDNLNELLKTKSTILHFTHLDCGHISVPLELNGCPLEFMLDTGCSYTQLWKNSVLKQLKPEDFQPKQNNSIDGKYSLNLKLGNLLFSQVPTILQNPLSVHEKTLSGFLAGNILENFVVTVDFRNNNIILANSLQKIRNEATIIVPMIVRDHCPVCSVKLDDTLEVAALLDTGSPRSIAPDSLLEPLLRQKLVYNNHISGPWFGKIESQKVTLKKLSLGAFSFNSPSFDMYRAAKAPKAASEIILGNDFLGKFKSVTFDYPGRKVIFEPK